MSPRATARAPPHQRAPRRDLISNRSPMRFRFDRRPPQSPLHAARSPRRDAPFVLEDRLHDVAPNGDFVPAAALWLSPALARSGLLRDLSPEEIRLLLGVLSCLSPHGAFAATPPVVARALGLSERETGVLLERMAQRPWKGAPLLRGHRAPSGLRFFAPAPHLLDLRRSIICPAPPPGERAQVHAPPAKVFKGVAREAAVARSRALYGRPRAHVEADTETFFASGRTGRGSDPLPAGIAAPAPAEAREGKEAVTSETAVTPEEAVTPEAREWLALKRRLAEAGVPHSRADELLAAYPPERILRQLGWLPLRRARKPVAYLLAAIEHDYGAPHGAIEPSTNDDKQNPDAAQDTGDAKR